MIKKKSNSAKVKDSGQDISRYGRLDRYWKGEGFKNEYLNLRRPALTQQKVMGTETDPMQRLIKQFKIVGVEFGNWVNNDARNSYLIAAIVAFTDLHTITGFGSKAIGFGKLGIAFGARGHSKAHGHFEPSRVICKDCLQLITTNGTIVIKKAI